MQNTDPRAEKAGLTDEAIEHRVKSARWERRHASVYAVASVPRSWERTCWPRASPLGYEHHSSPEAVQ